MSTFDDAQRYLDMRAAGWTDPTVDPHTMIAEIIAAQYECQEDMHSAEDYDELERAHAESLKDPTAWNLDVLTHAQLVTHLRAVSLALADAASRERRDALADAEHAVREKQRTVIENLTDENRLLRTQATAVFGASPMAAAGTPIAVASKPRRKRASKEG